MRASITKDQLALTAEQRTAAEALARDYTATILSTDPADEPAIECAVTDAYRAGGLEPPKRVCWFDSPLAFVIARTMANSSVWASVGDSVRTSVRDSVGTSVRDSVWTSVWTSVGASVRVWTSVRDSVGTSVGDSVRTSVRDSVGTSVRDSVWTSVWTSVGASVRDSVWTSVGASVGDSVGDSVGASVWDSVRDSVWTSVGASVGALYDAAWLAFYQFFHEHLQPNALAPLTLVNRATHGYWFGERECWLVRRAVKLDRDERGRLHSEDGMAARYADGWGLYAWHGVRLAGALGEKIIMAPDTLTRDDWASERNTEVRRAIQERLGAARFVARVGAQTVHRDECGELVEVLLPDDPERIARYVHVVDPSTAREYYLRVPPWLERARAAVAWTFDIPEAEYCPLQEA